MKATMSVATRDGENLYSCESSRLCTEKMHQHLHSCYYSWQLSMIIAFASCHNSIPLALTYVVCISAIQLVFHSFMTKLYCISRWEIIIKSSEKSYLSRNPALWCDYKNEYEVRKKNVKQTISREYVHFPHKISFFLCFFFCVDISADLQQHNNNIIGHKYVWQQPAESEIQQHKKYV